MALKQDYVCSHHTRQQTRDASPAANRLSHRHMKEARLHSISANNLVDVLFSSV